MPLAVTEFFGEVFGTQLTSRGASQTNYLQKCTLLLANAVSDNLFSWKYVTVSLQGIHA